MAKPTGSPNLQDKILNEVMKQKAIVTLFTMNGVRQDMKIVGFDNFIILGDVKGKTQMFYKHAVSTIILPSNFTIGD